MNYFKYITSFLLIYSLQFVIAQTDSYGDLEIYTREAYISSFGYFSGSFELPDQLNNERISLSGVNFTHQYDISNLGNVAIGDATEIRFMMEGIFKIGGAIGDKSLDRQLEIYPTTSIKYYVLNLDAFTLSICPQLTAILDNGYAISFHLGVDLINVGGSVAILDKGVIDQHSVALINIIPLTFKPSLFFDFGRSGIGIGATINAVNILDYRIGLSPLYPDESGFYSFDSFFRKFEFQLLFTF